MADVALETPVVDFPAPPTDLPAEEIEKSASDQNVEATPQVQANVSRKAEPALTEDSEISFAKSFLQTYSEKSGVNLYDHLTTVLMKILETRPNNAADVFESVSAEIKRSKFRSENADAPNAFKKAKISAAMVSLAKSNMKLFESIPTEDPTEAAAKAAEEGGQAELPDIMDLSNMWEWAGLSLGKEETFTLFLSLRNLAETKQLKSVRLWGKITGTQNDYIIAESEMKEGVVDEDEIIGEPRQVETESAEDKQAEAVEGTENNDLKAKDGSVSVDFFSKDADIPKPKVKTVPALPKEDRIGVNKYIYYACHYAGGVWFRLPDVTPEQLQVSRKIRKYFTGDLKRKISSYPTFNGSEAHYLRCQLARISASTVVSPAGYYIFDQEEGVDDDSEQSGNVIINPEFEGLPNHQLLNLSNWVHHVPYVLPQGRVMWENPWATAKSDEDKNDDGDDDEKEEDDETGETANGSERAEPETGPAVLSPISSDEEHGNVTSWTSHVSSRLSPIKYSPVFLRSTRWPGAHVIAYGDKFCNFYIGDGHKDLGASPYYYAPLLAEIQKEYGVEGGSGDENEVAELNDPTVEEEKAFEEQMREKEEEKEEQEEEDAEEDADE